MGLDRRGENLSSVRKTPKHHIDDWLSLGKVFRSNIDNEDGTGWNEERRKPFCSVQHPWKTHL